jgi:hypothetical protein
LIAYWGDSTRPPRCLQLRVVKDDYDFTSALFYSAQNQGSVLGSIRFRSDGGDKHPSLDRIKDQTFSLSSLTVQLLLQQWRPNWRIFIDGRPATELEFTAPAGSRVAIDTGDVKILFQSRFARFLSPATQLRFVRRGDNATLSIVLFDSPTPQTVHWQDLATAGCDFMLTMDDSATPIASLDRQVAAQHFTEQAAADLRSIIWASRDGLLGVRTLASVKPIAEMDAGYEATLEAKAYPFVRLGQPSG